MLFVKPAYAVCPVCTIAAGSGLAIAKALGVSDLIASLWIGALVTSTAIWMADKFRLIKLPFPKISWSLIFYIITIATLYNQGKIAGPNCQKTLGVDTILFGLTSGAIVFWLGIGLDQLLRRFKAGQALFPLQKVVCPILTTLITSFIFHQTLCR